jgi:hypothetical protein
MKVFYRIVEHNGGWAYQVDDVYSETFATHDEALMAAQTAAAEQQVEGETVEIEYETADGVWHQEVASAQDRPEAAVEDDEK